MHIQCVCPNLVIGAAFGQSILGQNLGFTVCAAPKDGSAFFFPLSRPQFRSFCLSGYLLVEFWWCLKRRGTEM